MRADRKICRRLLGAASVTLLLLLAGATPIGRPGPLSPFIPNGPR